MLKKHRCFPVKFSNFLRTSFFIEHLRWLLMLILWLQLISRLVANQPWKTSVHLPIYHFCRWKCTTTSSGIPWQRVVDKSGREKSMGSKSEGHLPTKDMVWWNNHEEAGWRGLEYYFWEFTNTWILQQNSLCRRA